MEQANIVIVGGGVVGCAIACSLSSRWSDIFLLESLPKLGMLSSTRNSGVIHSGIYYSPGSLKAKHCVRGNRLTYEFCAKHGVPHKNIGKIVVASNSAESPELSRLMGIGKTNGVEGLRLIDREEIRAREPNVEGFQALHVPSTGILSSEDLVKTYARVAADRGANIVTRAKVERLEPFDGGIRIHSAAGEIETRCLINSAGLFADEVAGLLGSKLARHKIYPVRGEYCEIVRSRQDLIKALVYPLPHADGVSLGMHLTKTLSGSVLIGPTARYVDDKNDYEREREPVEYFAAGAKALLPTIEASDLVPAYSGIRAKLIPPHTSPAASTFQKSMADFIIERDPDFPSVIHLMGIESPGLSSAPAIGEHVFEIVTEVLN
jgi:glycerol-3-phosphate dehydrogenase